MRDFIQRIKQKRVLSSQIFFTVLSFIIMVSICYFFMNSVVRSHLLQNTENLLNNEQQRIEYILMESQIILNSYSRTIRNMILQGEDSKKMKNYVYDMYGYYMKTDKNTINIRGLYGYCETLPSGPVFVSSYNDQKPADYNPTNTEWYQKAIKAEGNIAEILSNEHSKVKDTIFTYARCIYDENGIRLGVFCIDILFSGITEPIVKSALNNDGIGVLCNSDYTILFHPNNDFIGLSVYDPQLPLSSFVNDFLGDKDISERSFVNYLGQPSVCFFRTLPNGWHLGLIIPKGPYYKSVSNMATMLFILGMAFSMVLIFIFIHVDTSNENIELLLDKTPLCVHLWNRKLKMFYCNEETVRLYNVKDKKEFMEHFHALSPEYQPNGDHSMETAEKILNRAFTESRFSIEWMHQTLDGVEIPTEMTFVRIPYKNDYAVIAYTRDLREQKKMMNEINAALNNLALESSTIKAMFDLAPDLIFCKDMNSNYTRCNKSFLNFFNVGLEDVIGKNDTEGLKLPLEVSEGFRVMDIKTMNEKRLFTYEEKIPAVDGSVRIFETNKIPLHKDGELMGIMAISRDVTMRKSMEEAAHNANRTKSAFLANMSHEIRTPMNTILGVAEMHMQDKSLASSTRDALERIYNSGELLLGIINDLLDMSKIEAGKLELLPVKYETASLINDTMTLNLAKLGSKPIKFSLAADENIPKVLLGDELRIKQVLNNLLSNSFKYTKKGTIVFSVFIEKKEYDIDSDIITLVFRVTDTGIGMTEEQLSKLFDEYTRFNMEANRLTQGTGLGMNITRNLLSMMHGEIHVKSRENVGSEFTVRIPQKRVSADVLGKELVESLQTFQIHSSKQIRKSQIVVEQMPYGKILIVDDVESNLYVAKGLMKPYMLNIETVMSGFDAIDKIKDGNVYDVIFMDHMMPHMDGVEATSIIRELGYEHPIVALTANAVVGQSDMFLSSGFNGFVSKPIDMRQLNAVLKEFIRDKQPPEVIEAARIQSAESEERERESDVKRDSSKPSVSTELAEIFLRDAQKVISTLQTILDKDGDYTDDDILSYTITTHGVKSSLANIGETELSAIALNLEQAGRSRNFDVISNETQAFLDKLELLIKNLTPQEKRRMTKITDVDMKGLRVKLLEMQDACSTYERKTAKDLVTNLRQKDWPGDINEKLGAIAEHLLFSDFDRATEIAGDVLQSLNV